MKLIFATNNQHKVDEIQSAIGDQVKVISLSQAGINIDIPEPHETLEDNASEKSGAIRMITGMNCFSEDTGLEVDALHGEPGVKSARYAGNEKSFDNNIEKLLGNLNQEANRQAQFRTVISLRLDEKEFFFEGICRGTIIRDARGEGGFGYDPVFVPEGSQLTFAEMSMEEKNKFSHRRKAADQLVNFLRAGHFEGKSQ
ncbi:MAG: RdgB/HAM1 family non-canonical purine NTP pyrophosphatase [Chitinophagales bacterium]